MSKMSNLMIFVAGVAVGSAATWHYVKQKYEQIAQEEIDSVKEVFSKKEEVTVDSSSNDSRSMAEKAKDKPSIVEYAAKLHEEGYTNYSTNKTEEVKKEVIDKEMYNEKPYIITPDEFGDIDGYETISLSYYADKILADDNDEVVDDVEDVVGFESLNHFGEYEDDSVFVRNDRLRCDYEILLDKRRYADVIDDRPYR